MTPIKKNKVIILKKVESNLYFNNSSKKYKDFNANKLILLIKNESNIKFNHHDIIIYY
jgi:hypothetical protein